MFLGFFYRFAPALYPIIFDGFLFAVILPFAYSVIFIYIYIYIYIYTYIYITTGIHFSSYIIYNVIYYGVFQPLDFNFNNYFCRQQFLLLYIYIYIYHYLYIYIYIIYIYIYIYINLIK